MPDIRVSFFGRLALEMRLVTLEQIQECVSIQLEYENRGKAAPRLGELLVQKSYLTDEQVESILARQREKAAEAETAQPLKNLESAYAPGEVILREGDDTHHDLYILLTGTVEESKGGLLLDEHDAKGTFLGEIGTLLKVPRPTTVRAKTQVRTYRVPEANVENFFRNKPAMAIRISEVLAERLNKVLTEHMETGATPLPAKTPVAPEPAEAAPPVAVESEPEAPPPPPPRASAPPPSAMSGATDDTAIVEMLNSLKSPQFPDPVRHAASARMNLYIELDKLEQQRAAVEKECLEREEELPESLESEYGRQRREAERFPKLEALRVSLQKLKERLAAPVPAPRPETEVEAAEDGEAPAGPPPLTAELRAAYELGIKQKQILLKREQTTAELLRTCAAYCVDEPLYRIFRKYGIAGDLLFGWAVYALALEAFQAVQNDRQKDLRKKRQELEESTRKSGIFNLLKKQDEEGTAQADAARDEEQFAKLMSGSLARELRAIEPRMVDEFWTVYAAAAQQLVAGLEDADAPYVRAFLRWGLLGCQPRFIGRTLARDLLCECARGGFKPEESRHTTHVYYADELIELVAQGTLSPSPNEDLELNRRNSPEWRADRAWRRLINIRWRMSLLREIAREIAADAAATRQHQNDAAAQLDALGGNKLRMNEIKQLRQEVQKYKVEAGRKERLTQKVRDEMLPKLDEDGQSTEDSLQSSGVKVTAACLAAHEVACMRRNARLVAKLKEPFLPFCLRDNFKPAQNAVNDRKTLLAAVADAEARDPLLFQEPLVPTNNKKHRVLVRYCPSFVIAPAMGIMGFLVTPRAGLDTGRITLPGYHQNAAMREPTLWNVLADYRYDTSKAGAGVDLMNSDTLVAAYAQVRWDLRKKDREVRQKAGIYTEENERTNWRRHYQIYMKSAMDAGKQLFFKCPELYDLIINKYVELPAGLEPLKR